MRRERAAGRYRLVAFAALASLLLTVLVGCGAETPADFGEAPEMEPSAVATPSSTTSPAAPPSTTAGARYDVWVDGELSQTFDTREEAETAAKRLRGERPEATVEVDVVTGPVLEQLPPLGLENLAMVEVWTQAQAEEPRILSPGAHADAVATLLAAYSRIVLKPEEGFPYPEDIYATLLMGTLFRMKDGRTVQLYLLRDGRVAVQDGPDAINRGDPVAPQAWGYSAELAPLIMETIAQADPRDFAPGFVLPPDMPQDFGFALAYGVTRRNLLDTFAGTFTKDLVYVGTISTALALSADELADIYQDLRRLDIAAYPAHFQPPHEGLWHSPSEAYYLRLRVAGQEKEIYWRDENDSTAPQAVSLRELFKKIQRLIQAKPEYQALPPAEGLYAWREGGVAA